MNQVQETFRRRIIDQAFMYCVLKGVSLEIVCVADAASASRSKFAKSEIFDSTETNGEPQ